jgi:hypothetical protein
MAAPQKDETASTEKDIKHTSSKDMQIHSDVKHYNTVVLGGGKGGSL